MKCATCGREMHATWIKRQPVAYAYYSTTEGLVILCSGECEQRWVSR